MVTRNNRCTQLSSRFLNEVEPSLVTVTEGEKKPSNLAVNSTACSTLRSAEECASPMSCMWSAAKLGQLKRTSATN